MNEILLILRWLILILYFVSFSYYLAYFKNKSHYSTNVIRIWITVACTIHSVYIILLGLCLGHLPIGDLFQVLTTFAWLSVLVYIFLEFRLKEMTMGVFFVPIVFILHLVSNIFIDVKKPLAAVLDNVIFEIHVAILIFAYAAFAISFITSVMYILLSREMKSKKFGIFFKRLPSLVFFDHLSNQAVNIGVVLAALGISIGFYMGLNVWEGMWALDPKLLTVIFAWCIYVTHFVTRKTIGWQGRRAAILSVIGFNWLLFSFIIVNLFFSKFHNFQ